MKKLKRKQLTSFINQVAASIPDGITNTTPPKNVDMQRRNTSLVAPVVTSGIRYKPGSTLSAVTVMAADMATGHTAATPNSSKKPEYIRGKKLSLIEMGPSFVKKFEMSEEEMPVLFVGKKLVRFERGSVEVQQIVDSYITFKELSGESEADALALTEDDVDSAYM